MLSRGHFPGWMAYEGSDDKEARSESDMACPSPSPTPADQIMSPSSSLSSPSESKAKRKRPKFIRKVDCQVCGDVANDHIHYGAIACYSCRAFFRRGVNANAPYYCSQNKNCPITKNTRKHCQYCRFQKCLSIGMKGSWVMTEEDKVEKKRLAMIKRLAKLDKKSHGGGGRGRGRGRGSSSANMLRNPGRLLSESYFSDESKESVSEKDLRSPEYSPFGDSSSCNGSSEVNLPKHLQKIRRSQPRANQSTSESSNMSYENQNQESPITSPFEGKSGQDSALGPPPVSSPFVKLEVQSEDGEDDVDMKPLDLPSSLQASPDQQNSSLHLVASPGVTSPMNSGSGGSVAQDSPHSSIESIPSPPMGSPPKPEVTFHLEPVSSILKQPSMVPFGENEQHWVDRVTKAELDTALAIPVPQNIIMEIVGAAKNNSAVQYKTLVEGYTICMKRIIMFAQSLPCFQSFGEADRKALLLSNTDMLVNIRSARLLRPGVNLISQVCHATGKEKNTTAVQAYRSPERLEYKQVFQSPWACDAYHEEKFADLMESLFHLEMDVTTTTLMSLLVLFSTSNTTVVAVEKGMKFQEFFAQLLYRYLCTKIGRPNANTLLPKYMYLISKLEEMAQIMVNKRLTLE